MPDCNGIYIVEVRGNKVRSVEKKDEPNSMEKKNIGDPDFKHDPPGNVDLKHGCIGVGFSFVKPEGPDQCFWRWDSWW